MAFRVKPNWKSNSAFDHVWEAACADYRTAPDEKMEWVPYYFETILKIKLIMDGSLYMFAEFENEAAYVLFMLEWS
jgi:hypothetical protein